MFITKINLNLFHKPVIYKYFKTFKGDNVCTPNVTQVYLRLHVKFVGNTRKIKLRFVIFFRHELYNRLHVVLQ